MTNEEKFSEEEYKLAEEVIKPIYRNAIQNDFSFAKYGVECYQAGLKAGKDMNVPIKWHILAENPTLPKEGQRVRVLTEEGVIEESTLFYDTYFEELTWSNIGLLKVLAWKEIEIPKE
jgi:hypothetical protein